MVAMSTRCGKLDSVSVSSVSRLAAISGRAAFLAPPMAMRPFRGRPPRMMMRSIESPVERGVGRDRRGPGWGRSARTGRL